jgi:hypothetical protein
VNRRIWPHDADHQVTVRATGMQLSDWAKTSRLLSLNHTGVFLAYAGDFTARHYRRLTKRLAKKGEKEREARETKEEGA